MVKFRACVVEKFRARLKTRVSVMVRLMLCSEFGLGKAYN